MIFFLHIGYSMKKLFVYGPAQKKEKIFGG